ncbi:glycoside hydrolase family 76 protein [Luteolibacter sp. GHJ8]|uniref:Glycoside hydrolase family 76 protein n=1 Tax=Luteolibacter rhizosphaerae TaxID=2989719 RepID=A0ABT3FYQ4_9BACT|nr:glycoside hydrolase family 76 protein [Luteolibacter rhizosphaerae]MCW1912724.1 glycoside hydrolase family 76 protein [Luteolibacter rhizosphaerae]
MKQLLRVGLALIAAVSPLAAQTSPYLEKAEEVSAHIQEHFWDRKSGLYMGKSGGTEPELIWGCGVMFSSLVSAARHDKKYRRVMGDFFEAMDAYWDVKVKIPGYEPARTQGGNDKYYDDNAWMVLTFLEAYELTKESKYLKRAEETLEFVVSGWDEEVGGGIWWHEAHKGGDKNTCVNAPAALGCFRLARFKKDAEAAKWNALGEKIVVWTVKTLQGENGLFWDNIKVATGEINKGQLTYNSALMLRNFLSLHTRTKEAFYLDEALRMGKAANGMMDGQQKAYRDHIKWAHLMVEADLELYRHTGQEVYLKRAISNTEKHYADWKKSPYPDLISQGSLARELWLLVDHTTPVGKEFWKVADQAKGPAK